MFAHIFWMTSIIAFILLVYARILFGIGARLILDRPVPVSVRFFLAAVGLSLGVGMIGPFVIMLIWPTILLILAEVGLTLVMILWWIGSRPWMSMPLRQLWWVPIVGAAVYFAPVVLIPGWEWTTPVTVNTRPDTYLAPATRMFYDGMTESERSAAIQAEGGVK